MTFWICVPPRPPHSFGQWMPTKPASALRALERLGALHRTGRVLAAAIAFHRARLAAFGVGFQEGAGLGAECGLVRGVFEVHVSVLPTLRHAAPTLRETSIVGSAIVLRVRSSAISRRFHSRVPPSASACSLARR